MPEKIKSQHHGRLRTDDKGGRTHGHSGSKSRTGNRPEHTTSDKQSKNRKNKLSLKRTKKEKCCQNADVSGTNTLEAADTPDVRRARSSKKRKKRLLIEARHHLPAVMPVYQSPVDRARDILTSARAALATTNQTGFEERITDVWETSTLSDTEFEVQNPSSKSSTPRKSRVRYTTPKQQKGTAIHPYASPELLQPSRRIPSPLSTLRQSLSKFSRVVEYKPRSASSNGSQATERSATERSGIRALFQAKCKEITPIHRKVSCSGRSPSTLLQALSKVLETGPNVSRVNSSPQNQTSKNSKQTDKETSSKRSGNTARKTTNLTLEDNASEAEVAKQPVVPSLPASCEAESSQDLDDIVNDLYLVIPRISSEDPDDKTVDNILSALRDLNVAESSFRSSTGNVEDTNRLKESRQMFVDQIMTFTSQKASEHMDDPTVEEALSTLGYNCLLYDVTGLKSNFAVSDLRVEAD